MWWKQKRGLVLTEYVVLGKRGLNVTETWVRVG